jgi:recombinational DNA repair protein RecR
MRITGYFFDQSQRLSAAKPVNSSRWPSKHILERVEQQAFAEAPGAAQKVILACGDQVDGDAGLVHVVAIVFADFAKGLNANGQLEFGQRCGREWGGGHQQILGGRLL